MTDIRVRDLPTASPAVPTDWVPIDNGTTRKVSITDLVDVGRPLASQAEAEAGTEPTKAMTPLTTAQAITAQGGVQFASAAQGLLADSALQPDDIGVTVASAAQGDLADSALQPAAIGASIQAHSANLDTISGVTPGATGLDLLADVSVADGVETLGLTYIKDYGSHSVMLRKFRSTFVDPSDWTSTIQAACNSGEPTIRFHSDAEITCTSQIVNTTSGQKWISDGTDNKAQVRRTTVVDEPFIIFQGERMSMVRMGIKCNSNTGMTALNTGLTVRRANGDPADIDFEFRDGYMSGFYYGFDSYGRGMSVFTSLISDVRYGVNFGWPAAGTYVKDRFVGDSEFDGFRRQRVFGCEFHSIEVAGVRNRGYNAANIACIVSENTSNFGRAIFAGTLGNGSVLRGNSVTNANTQMFELDGGTDYILQNNIMHADISVGGFSQPANFITMTGTHTGFVIDGFVGAYCTNSGIDMRSGVFQGIVRNIDLREVGTANPSIADGIVVVDDAPTEIIADGVTLRQGVAARSVIRMNTAGGILRHRGLLGIGAATPATSGAGTISPY